MPYPKTDLTSIIRRNINAAKLNPNLPSRETLRGGLRISIMFTGQAFNLQLDRVGAKPPSFKEWETVLGHWPYDVPIVQPARAYLVGTVPTADNTTPIENKKPNNEPESTPPATKEQSHD